MKKSGKNSNLRLVCLLVFVIFWLVLITANVFVMYTHCKNKKTVIFQKKSLWEKNHEDPDALDMSEIIKRYLIRSI